MPRRRGTIKEISQGRVPGERALTGEDRPATGTGGKAKGKSATPRGNRGAAR